MGRHAPPRKIVLAYSGGLDTSVILKWLQLRHECGIIAFTADIGQDEDLAPVREKAEMMGAEKVIIENLQEEFVSGHVFPVLRANALYEGQYLLGTAVARPLIARRLVEIARETGADAIAHGATGKGNDQVRFELAAWALDPSIRIIAPWREWELKSRTGMLAFADRHGIPVSLDRRGEAPFSVDANLLHVSAEGKVLEDPWCEPEEFVFSRTVAPEQAPDTPEYVEIGFREGDPVTVNGNSLSPAALLRELNLIAGRHGVGRLDMVENRFVGMKSRGIYETPGGTVLHLAHRAVESLTLDRGAAHLKDELMPRYAELVYCGFWYAPEREMLQALIDRSQRHVTGTARLKLFRGAATVVGRRAPSSLYSPAHVTFEADDVYDQADAGGFIRLNALRLRLLAGRAGGLTAGEGATPDRTGPPAGTAPAQENPVQAGPVQTKLDSLRRHSIIVADSGDAGLIGSYRPTDCTTNPALILKAAALPGSRKLLEDALAFGRSRGESREACIGWAADRLLAGVGAALAGTVPGLVSLEVDPALSRDTGATVGRARRLVRLCGEAGLPGTRVLVKIAATIEGVGAVRLLAREGIACNLTLVFSLVQAAAGAAAGAAMVSPFAGRVLDWHRARTGRDYPPEEDPGVLLVRRIYDYCQGHGRGCAVMGASFRSVGQIEALAGCDRLTIAPALLEALASSPGEVPRKLFPEEAAARAGPLMDTGPEAFRALLDADEMASEQLRKGIALFEADMHSLRKRIDEAL